MSNFAFWSMAYQLGWATKEEVQEAAQLGLLTPEQANQILKTNPITEINPS
ncbi:XkdX family protein [Aneurinibacillus thermoaerophilus]|uniref:XkdX family protein n=1 Tax=Aneurinibacillus thermoaerophilus TaxID=143495 RepID=UPI002E21D55E|nr:XkdX family protein [Aneurinibacillus thermoaerophilus]MED0762769.1 XkdX family protein [Aneurinibacillus thermoaerophilus]